jgi:NAD(P)H dehydrogenase (quinone)
VSRPPCPTAGRRAAAFSDVTVILFGRPGLRNRQRTTSAHSYAGIETFALDESRIIGIEGDGQVTAAARADLATAAAVVATTDGHNGGVYELTGGAGFTVRDFAGLLTRASEKTIAYDDVPVEEFAKLLSNVLGPELVQPTVDLESAIRAGQLSGRSADLENLLGRAPATVEQALAAFLQQVSGANR